MLADSPLKQIVFTEDTVKLEVSEAGTPTNEGSNQGDEQVKKDEKPPEQSSTKGDDEEGAQAVEGEVMTEEPQEKPQLSDPEEPQDDVPIALVTGASGYLASHIVKQLLKQGRYRVRGTVRSLENEKKVKPLRNLVANPKYPLRLIEANLLNPKSWTEAVHRCSYVFHVASPIPMKSKDPEFFIKPAVEGTTNVLKACSEAGTVKRVVFTSSIVAVVGLSGDLEKPQDYVYTEADWANEEVGSGYEKSKVKAEKIAWDFVKKLDDNKQFELVTLCPGMIVGPILSPSHKEGTVSVFTNMLSNKTPRLADLYFMIVDVRDTAAAHIAALEKPEAAGNRYICVNERLSMKDIAQIFADEFIPQGYKISTKVIPKAVMWAAKFIVSEVRMIYPMLGKQLSFSNKKMRGELGIEPRPVKETLINMAYNVIEMGVVEKKPGYLGHPSTRPPPEKKESEGAATKEAQEPSQPQEKQQTSEQAETQPPSEPAVQDEPPSDPTVVQDEEQPAKEQSSCEPVQDDPPSQSANVDKQNKLQDTPAPNE